MKYVICLFVVLLLGCSDDKQGEKCLKDKGCKAFVIAVLFTQAEQLNETISNPDLTMDAEKWELYEAINLYAPHELVSDFEKRRLAMAALGKVPKPEIVKLYEELKVLISDHPKSLEEMRNGKQIKLFLKHTADCPKGMFAYVYPAGHPKAFEPIFHIDLEGKIHPI